MARPNKPASRWCWAAGAARGWAHIGVIHQLAEMGTGRPGGRRSVGAVVAGAYASGNLDAFEQWISGLSRVDIIRLLDAKMTGGGFLQGNSLMGAIEKHRQPEHRGPRDSLLRGCRTGHRPRGLAARGLAGRLPASIALPGCSRRRVTTPTAC